jgi:hypothetical protein
VKRILKSAVFVPATVYFIVDAVFLTIATAVCTENLNRLSLARRPTYQLGANKPKRVQPLPAPSDAKLLP